MADVNISSSSAPISASTQKAAPAYKLRTMASDIEALKKGVIPKAFAVLEKTAVAAPPVSLAPAVMHPPVSSPDESSQLNNNAAASIPVSAKIKPAFPTKVLPPQIQSAQTFNANIQPKPVLPPVSLPISSTPTPSPAPAPRPPIVFKTPEPLSIKEPFSAPIGKPFQTAPSFKAPPAQQPKPLSMSVPPPLPARPFPPQGLPSLPSAAAPLPPTRPMPLRPLTLPPPPFPPARPLMPASSFPLPESAAPSAIFPSIESLPPIPSLPPLPLASEIIKPRKSKIMILAFLALVVLVFIGGEIWWFFLREKPQTAPAAGTNELLPEPSLENMNNLLPPPPESVTPSTNLAPEESAPTEITALPDLLAFDRAEIITIDSVDTAGIARALGNLSSLGLKEDELVKIILQSTSTPAAKVEFNDLVGALKLKLPPVVNEMLNSGDFNLFVFGANAFDQDICRHNKNNTASCFGPRLGLVFKLSQSTGLASALKSWEKTMVSDLKALILAKIGSPATAVFQNGTYNNQILRYKNLPLNTITIDYALAGDLFILTTSKSSMLRAIDALK